MSQGAGLLWACSWSVFISQVWRLCQSLGRSGLVVLGELGLREEVKVGVCTVGSLREERVGTGKVEGLEAKGIRESGKGGH